MPKTEDVVYIIDDDENIRNSTSRLIEAVGRKVVTFSSGQDFLDLNTRSGIGCIILDVRMPGMSGLSLQNKLKEASSLLPIIFITGHGDVSTAAEAFKGGAVDFLQKPFRDQELLDAIDKSIEASKKTYNKMTELKKIEDKVDLLTGREREVMEKIVDAKTNKMIALELGLSPKTVDFHRCNIMEKMGVNSAVQLTVEIVKLKHFI